MNPKLRILVVDDDRGMTRTLSDILGLKGYHALVASSGHEALEAVETQALDCVLSDVRMPDMNGVELYRAIRTLKPGLPMLLMTAYASDALMRTGLQEGIVGVLDKPLDLNRLLSFLVVLLETVSDPRVVLDYDDRIGRLRTVLRNL